MENHVVKRVQPHHAFMRGFCGRHAQGHFFGALPGEDLRIDGLPGVILEIDRVLCSCFLPLRWLGLLRDCAEGNQNRRKKGSWVA